MLMVTAGAALTQPTVHRLDLRNRWELGAQEHGSVTSAFRLTLEKYETHAAPPCTNPAAHPGKSTAQAMGACPFVQFGKFNWSNAADPVGESPIKKLAVTRGSGHQQGRSR